MAAWSLLHYQISELLIQGKKCTSIFIWVCFLSRTFAVRYNWLDQKKKERERKRKKKKKLVTELSLRSLHYQTPLLTGAFSSEVQLNMYIICYTGACVHESHQVITINRIHFTLAIALFSVVYVQYGLIMGDSFFIFKYKMCYGKQLSPLEHLPSTHQLLLPLGFEGYVKLKLIVSLSFSCPVILIHFLPFLTPKCEMCRSLDAHRQHMLWLCMDVVAKLR